MEYDMDSEEVFDTSLMFQDCPECPNPPRYIYKGKYYCTPHYIAQTYVQAPTNVHKESE
jgi:hypothetical protein